MHDSRRWRLVCYDIRDVKRYRLAYKLIQGYGERVQYSIFRCRLDDRQLAELRWKLARILDPTDSLLVIDICTRCASKVVVQNQLAGWDAAPATFAIVGHDHGSDDDDSSER